MNMKRFFCAMGVTVLVLIMIFGGWSAARFLFHSTLSETIDGLDSVTGQRVNILCMGLDKDKTRSDTIMLVSVDTKHGTVKLLSIPRDTRVEVNGSHIKINATMGYNRRETLMIEKIRELTGLPVHYYAEIDFEGFKKVIDILGGIDYNVPYDMDYDDPTQDLHIHLEAGMQHLDGQAAHDFVRFRQNNDKTMPGEYAMGDEGRIQAQQAFIKELFAQKLKPQYILKAPELVSEVYKYVKTNLSAADAVRLFVPCLKNLSPELFVSYQLPGESQYFDHLWWYICDPEKTDELVQNVFLTDGIPTASPSPSAGASTDSDDDEE